MPLLMGGESLPFGAAFRGEYFVREARAPERVLVRFVAGVLATIGKGGYIPLRGGSGRVAGSE